jgi:hypothetical protein
MDLGERLCDCNWRLNICKEQDVQPLRKRSSGVVVEFPTDRTRRRAARPTPEFLTPVSALPHRGSVVVPLRHHHAAQRAAVLVKIRRLHAEIEALTIVWQRRNRQPPTRQL